MRSRSAPARSPSRKRQRLKLQFKLLDVGTRKTCVQTDIIRVWDNIAVFFSTDQACPADFETSIIREKFFFFFLYTSASSVYVLRNPLYPRENNESKDSAYPNNECDANFCLTIVFRRTMRYLRGAFPVSSRFVRGRRRGEGWISH